MVFLVLRPVAHFHEAFRLGRILVQAVPVPKRETIVKCLFETVKDCPKRKRCAPLRGGFAILDCPKQAAHCP
jgi:hypothetical protein